MNKRNLFSFVWLLALGTVSLPAQTKQAKKIGDFIESTSYNEHKRGAERTLQYYPEGDDFVYKREEPVYQSVVRKLVAFSS